MTKFIFLLLIIIITLTLWLSQITYIVLNTVSPTGIPLNGADCSLKFLLMNIFVT